MAAGPHTFATYDVFTAERYTGNPLAIVSVRSPSSALSQSQKQKIAREFSFSETVFLHDAPDASTPRRVDIFTPESEVPFAGHPVIGVAHFILGWLDRGRVPPGRDGRLHGSILTKAGKINIYFSESRTVAAAEVPFDFHEHSSPLTRDALAAIQTALLPQMERLNETYPVVSIVKGMAFSLIDLSSTPYLMTSLVASIAPEVALDDSWSPSLVGSFFYVELPPEDTEDPPIYKVRARMMIHGTEDPATGSASCALSCHLALKKAAAATDDGEQKGMSTGDGGTMYVFAIQQGVEMGRPSQICVEVTLAKGGKDVQMVVISGRAVAVTKGELLL